jgi:uncharacterized membrane protein YphA (DoxX/SURF4 family)
MQSGRQAAGVSKKMLWAGRIISALPVLLLLFAGSMKLMKPPAVVEGFSHYGYPEQLIMAIGIVELTCAVLYAVPRTAVLGAILMTAFMGGATATHVRMGEPFIMPVLVGVFVWLGLFLRDERLRTLVLFGTGRRIQ